MSDLCNVFDLHIMVAKWLPQLQESHLHIGFKGGKAGRKLILHELFSSQGSKIFSKITHSRISPYISLAGTLPYIITPSLGAGSTLLHQGESSPCLNKTGVVFSKE